MNDGPRFFETRMGQVFYQGTLPKLIAQLELLNERLERLTRALEARQPHEVEDKPGKSTGTGESE